MNQFLDLWRQVKGDAGKLITTSCLVFVVAGFARYALYSETRSLPTSNLMVSITNIPPDILDATKIHLRKVIEKQAQNLSANFSCFDSWGFATCNIEFTVATDKDEREVSEQFQALLTQQRQELLDIFIRPVLEGKKHFNWNEIFALKLQTFGIDAYLYRLLTAKAKAAGKSIAEKHPAFDPKFTNELMIQELKSGFTPIEANKVGMLRILAGASLSFFELLMDDKTTVENFLLLDKSKVISYENKSQLLNMTRAALFGISCALMYLSLMVTYILFKNKI